MEEYNTKLEQIERFLTGGMTAPERADFDRMIAGDEQLQAEVSDYQTLLRGFSQIKENTFRAQFASWDEDWAATEDTEWIEAYLAGELHPDLAQKITLRLKNDPTLAAQVADYQQLMTGFSGLKERAFAKKMQEWSQEENAPQKTATVRSLRPIFIRIAAAASVLLILGIGFNWYAQNNYSGTTLAANYYQEPSTGNTMGNNATEKAEIAQLFSNAHREYNQGQYTAAISIFDNLLVTLADSKLETSARAYYEQNALWTRSLALIAQGEDVNRAKASLQAIAADPQNEYQQKAAALLEQMDSVFYRWANS